MAKGDFRLRKSLRDRLYEKFVPDPNSGCWLWTGAVNHFGYGIIGLGHRSDGIDRAHRVSYRIHKGNTPQGMAVLHSCDVPSCINPNHLRVGTLSENMKDCVSRKRNFIPNNRGEQAKWAKLTADAAADIKKREMTGPAYAAKYGVSRSAVYRIWEGKNWASK